VAPEKKLREVSHRESNSLLRYGVANADRYEDLDWRVRRLLAQRVAE
jgi:hypothetical protein